VATYADVLADPEVEAIYNPLPNGLHAPWNLAAIAAGKHVLSEKPFAADADEAREVRDAGADAGLVVAEAFHYVHHP
jgi:predicted dehydrogenase